MYLVTVSSCKLILLQQMYMYMWCEVFFVDILQFVIKCLISLSLSLQTLYVTDELMLCDCPGLVFPNFVSSKAEMICNGILPIDQMRDHVPPVSLVCQRIPRHLLEATYGIRLPQPGEGEDGRRVPYAHELLEAYGCK